MKKEKPKNKGDSKVMKKMRKAISLIVALCFLLSIAAPAMAADASDVEKAGNRLLALGIIEGYTDGTLGLDKQITRAEIAVVLAKASGMASAAEMLKNTPSKFTDVKTGEWYTGWINLAASQGWVKGDPQGTFRPNDPISYREIVTVLLKILGYNDNLPGDWPVNYLAKAASLGITKGISFDAKAPAVRGDVFLMTSRVLDKEVVVWDNDKNEFVYKNGKTLLEDKLDFATVEGVVTDIPRVNNSLKDNQIKINNKTYKVVANVDFEEIFGAEVEAWLNDNDEVVFVSIESEILYDALVDVYEDELTLKAADEEYDIANDATIYVNGEKLTTAERKALKDAEFDYAKVVLNDDGDVAFVDAYNWDDFLVVEKVDGKVVLGYGEELDAEDFTIVKDGKTITLEDLKEGDILFYNKDAEYAEVYNKSVEGEIERIYTDRIKVAGKEYRNSKAKYINEDGDIAKLNNPDFVDIVETMKDAGKVVVFLNRKGDMIFLAGDLSDLTTVSRYAMITKVGGEETRYTGRNGGIYPLDVINAEGKVLKYDIEVNDLQDIFGSTSWPFTAGDKNTVIEIAYDKDGDIDEITILSTKESLSNFKVTEKYVNGYKIKPDAIVFLVEDYISSNDTDDIEISTYAELDFDVITSGTAFIKNDEVVAFVVTGSDREEDTTKHYTVATADDIKDAVDNIYTLKLVIDGKKVTVDTKKNISNYPGVKKGDLLKVDIDKKTGYVVKVEKVASELIDSGTVSDLKAADKSFKVGGRDYKLGADAVVVDETNSYNVISLSSLKVGDTVKVVKVSSDSKYVELVVRTAKAGSTTPEPVLGGAVTYFDSTGKAVSSVKLYNGQTLNLTVKFTNEGNKSISLAANAVKYNIVDEAGFVVDSGYLNTSQLMVLPGKTVTFDNDINNTGLGVGKYTVLVTIPVGGTDVIESTLEVEVVENNNANLTGITISGPHKLEPAFAADITSYVAKLPEGTTTVPTVDVTPADPNATVAITYAQKVDGTLDERTTTIVVTAEDGVTKKTYKVVFVLNNAPEVDGGIDDITAGAAGGNIVIDLAGAFKDDDGDQLTYTAQIDSDLNDIISSVLVVDGKVIIVPQGSNVGTATVKVTASDGLDSVDIIFNVNLQ